MEIIADIMQIADPGKTRRPMHWFEDTRQIGADEQELRKSKEKEVAIQKEASIHAPWILSKTNQSGKCKLLSPSAKSMTNLWNRMSFRMSFDGLSRYLHVM